MPKSTQIMLSVILLVCVALVASASSAETPHRVSAKTVERNCEPFPAPCGETMDWSAGVGYAVVLEQQQLEAFLASIAPKASSGGGGRYPRGCVGGESACIPTTAGTCVLPAYICARESSAINKWNYGGSGASGKYQAMPSTWGGYAGFQYAADAPEAIQDLWASELWNNGQGCSHWSAC